MPSLSPLHSFADKDLKFNVAKHFSLELKYDAKMSRRLSLLMGWGKDAEKHAEYTLVSVPEIRDSFLRTFCSSSSSLSSTTEDNNDARALEHLSRLADAFARALTGKEGKSIISRWRLAEMLELESGSAEACLDAAQAFATTKEEGRAAISMGSGEMTTWDFCKRAGFSNETFAHRLEEEGYVLARSLQGLDEAKFKDVGIGHGPEEPKLRRILKLVGAKDEHAADVRGVA